MGDIQAAQTMVELSDAKTLANLKAIENGEDLGLSNWIHSNLPNECWKFKSQIGGYACKRNGFHGHWAE